MFDVRKNRYGYDCAKMRNVWMKVRIKNIYSSDNLQVFWRKSSIALYFFPLFSLYFFYFHFFSVDVRFQYVSNLERAGRMRKTLVKSRRYLRKSKWTRANNFQLRCFNFPTRFWSNAAPTIGIWDFRCKTQMFCWFPL